MERRCLVQLLTKELRKKLPPLGATSKDNDPLAVVKYFTPDSNWTWYAIEFDGEDTFYGLVHGFEEEFGTFSLAELETVTGPLGLHIERDLYFEAKPVSKLRRR
jgi:Protein of unknown function (DUF2958)